MSYEWQAPQEGDERSPCPALNALANHGYLPRNGKDITPRQLFEALQKVFNENTSFAMYQVAGCFTLYGENWVVRNDLVDQLITNSIDGKIKSESIKNTFRARYLDCKENNPDFTFGFFQVQLASGEYSLFQNIMGANTNKEVDVKIAETFFREERLANEWTRPNSSVSLSTIFGTSNEFSKIINAEIKKLN
ncbi:652_t:CDS:2 [Scutellospora calospora]|uniref:652_t:CDS:1 n=1 Tax=Scutellospora calospora TaxID=85575 RepID=A0ACA9LI90_9GLOM|nr:652_t:CDS:2 [Scutellospora calospora]